MKRNILAVCMLLLAVTLTACGGNKVERPAANTVQGEEVVITHRMGETKVKKNPQKVVVFDFGALDTLERWGVPISAIPQDVIPPYLSKYKDKKYANAGGVKEPDFEKISALKPDLIIISGRQEPAYKELSQIAPTIDMQIDQKNYLSSFKHNVSQLAEIFDKKDAAEQELKQIDEKIAAIKTKAAASDKQALVIMTTGGKLHAFGPGSRFALIHDVLGIKSVMGEQDASSKEQTIHGQVISFEYIAEKNPDYLFVIDRDDAIGENATAKQMLNNDLIKNTKAFKENGIVYLEPGLWYLAGGGLVSVSNMIDQVGKALQ